MREEGETMREKGGEEMNAERSAPWTRAEEAWFPI